MATNDFDLLDRWRAGEAAAGNELFECYGVALARFFHNKAGARAEDLVQDTMLACLESQDKFERRGNFRSYMFGVARYQLYAYYRRQRRDGEVLDFATVTAFDLGASPSTLAAEQNEHRILLTALQMISLEHQIVLELCYWEDLTVPELGEILELDPAAVYSRIRRAKQQLKRQLDFLQATPRPQLASNGQFEDWANLLKPHMRRLPR
jgi:RNA polymerase sigma factor (sigma-70 family)